MNKSVKWIVSFLLLVALVCAQATPAMALTAVQGEDGGWYWVDDDDSWSSWLMEAFRELVNQSQDDCYTAAEAQENGGKLDLSTVSTSQFVDWNPNTWYANRDSVKYAVGMGYVNGRGSADGLRFDGSDSVTVNEFVTVLVRMVVKPEAIEACRLAELKNWAYLMNLDPELESTQQRFSANEHWFVSQGYSYAAAKYGIAATEMTGTNGNVACNRATMARLMVRAVRARGEGMQEIRAKDAAGRMSDIAGRRYNYEYEDYIEDIGYAAGLGLIAGMGDGRFHADALMDRASMCELIFRMDNVVGADGRTPRDEVIEKVFGNALYVPRAASYYPVDLNDTTPITIRMGDLESIHRIPYEGDTVIRPDGTSVVLEYDPVYGVLGWGQNCDPWTGSLTAEGYILKVGNFGGVDGAVKDKDYYNRYCNIGRLVPRETEGYEWETHWSGEFQKIYLQDSNAIYEGTFEKPEYEGQVSKNGLWTVKNTGYKLVWTWNEYDTF